MKREDLRVRRTRKQLIEAMIALTIQNGFNKVTVQEISEHAMINRATFYRYFQDKYDLLNQYLEEQYNLQLAYDESDALTSGHMDVPGKPPQGLVRMWEIIQTQAAFFRVMLGPKGDPAFTQKLRFHIEKRIRGNLLDFSDANATLPFEMCLSYISSASIGLIQWWLEKDMPYSPNQMAAWCIQFSNADLDAALGQVALTKKPAE